jgi:hypothetical protein
MLYGLQKWTWDTKTTPPLLDDPPDTPSTNERLKHENDDGD